MALNDSEIKKIAELARLELTPEEEQLYARQLSEVLGYIDQLESFATADPVHENPLPEAVDEVSPGLALEAFLANAPESLDRFLLVPQVKKSERS